MIIEELVSVLGLDISDNGLPEFRQNVIGTTTKIGALIGITFTAAAAISSFLDSTRDAAADNRLAESLDISFNQLQRIDFAMKQATGSSDSLRGGLQGLRSAADSASVGLNEGAIQAFAMAGISIHNMNGELKTADQLLLEVADAVASHDDPAFARTIAQRLGLGPDFLLFLRLSAAGINKLGDEGERLGAIMSEDASAAAVEFRQDMDALGDSINALMFEQGGPFLEWLASTTDRFRQFLGSESGQNAVEAIGSLLDDLGRIAGAPLALLSKLSTWLDEIGVPSKVQGVLAIAAAVATMGLVFGPTALTVVALAAGLQEFNAFLEGADNSIIRKSGNYLVEKAKEIGEILASDGPVFGVKSLNQVPTSGLFGPQPAPASSSTVIGAPKVEITNNITANGVGSAEELARASDRVGADEVRQAIQSLQSDFRN